MLRSLTVEETLMFSAKTRLPARFTSQQRAAVVQDVIELLGLSDVRHSCIGDENVRGISGGQRKRVNLGIELVADPTVLFLDGQSARAAQRLSIRTAASRCCFPFSLSLPSPPSSAQSRLLDWTPLRPRKCAKRCGG